MAGLIEVPVTPRTLGGLDRAADPNKGTRLREITEQLRTRLAGRVVWNVSSAPSGGSVAELLHSLVAYARGAGIDARWVAIRGSREFFLVAKGLRRALHGAADGPLALGPRGRALYEEVLHENALELSGLVGSDDVVVLHDSQTAGLIPHLVGAGARVIWRCHIGSDEPNPHSEQGWEFLAPYLDPAHAYVFTRKAFVPQVCDPARTEVIPATIDPRSPKNQELAPETVRAILVHAGILEGPPGDGVPEFVREDGTPGRVDRCADVIRLGPAPAWDTPVVVQIARWDPLKDPVGVLNGFCAVLEAFAPRPVDLVLAGPNVRAVADDPEEATVFNAVLDAWRHLPHAARRHIHLVHLPMTDVEENAAMVNALQRHAAVVVQKSVCEGVGLAVSEAMWKGRPVVGSAVGAISEQIAHGETGLLVEDPGDLEGFAQAVGRVLEDATLASALGRGAREHVRKHLSEARSLERWHAVLRRVDEGKSQQA